MNENKKNIIFGVFAPRTDYVEVKNFGDSPIITLCSFEDLPIIEFNIFFQPKYTKMIEEITQEIIKISPKTQVNLRTGTSNTVNFESFYLVAYEYFKNIEFDTKKYNYYFYFPLGVFPHVAYAVILLINHLNLPIEIIQVYNYAINKKKKGNYSIYPINLSGTLSKREIELKNYLPDQDFLKLGISTKNKHYNNQIAQLEYVAVHSNSPILLSGDTGTGKSQLAKSIYALKKKHGLISGSFIAVNCSMLKGEMAVASLFGHSKGAFTGAIENRAGYFLAANDGILFLDEIGDLGLEEQALLLNVLEDKSFLPLGSDKLKQSSFQLICGTNKDLTELVNAGKFRLDLFTRINLWHFVLLPLSQRREDIIPNIEYELHRLSLEKNKLINFSPEAKKLFYDFACSAQALWLGNFRELAATIDRMATFANNGIIEKIIVQNEIDNLQASWQKMKQKESSVSENKVFLNKFLPAATIESLDLFEQNQLAHTIGICLTSKNLADAGKKLFAVSRTNKSKVDDTNRLYKYLKKYGISFEQIKSNQ